MLNSCKFPPKSFFNLFGSFILYFSLSLYIPLFLAHSPSTDRFLVYRSEQKKLRIVIYIGFKAIDRICSQIVIYWWTFPLHGSQFDYVCANMYTLLCKEVAKSVLEQRDCHKNQSKWNRMERRCMPKNPFDYFWANWSYSILLICFHNMQKNKTKKKYTIKIIRRIFLLYRLAKEVVSGMIIYCSYLPTQIIPTKTHKISYHPKKTNYIEANDGKFTSTAIKSNYWTFLAALKSTVRHSWHFTTGF